MSLTLKYRLPNSVYRATSYKTMRTNIRPTQATENATQFVTSFVLSGIVSFLTNKLKL